MKAEINRELISVISVMSVGVLAMSMLQPILPLYLTSIGVSPELLGLMFSVAMMGMVIGESGWGWIADIIGIRLPLTMGTAVCAVIVIFFAFTKNILLIFLIFFIWGTFRSALFGPGRGFIGMAAPTGKKATYMAIISVMLAASRSLGAFPSGILADSWGYHSVIYVSCFISLIAGVMVPIGLKQSVLTDRRSSAYAGSHQEGNKIKLLIAFCRPLASQCIIATLQFFGLGIFATFLPLLATEVVGVTATKVGVLFTLGGVLAMIMGIPMGLLADHGGKKLSIIMGLILSSIAMMGMAFVHLYSWLIGFVALRSIGMVMYSPAALGLLSDSVPKERQSTVMGVYGGVCENTGIIAGSALGGFVWATLGPEIAFFMGGVAGILGAVICIAFVESEPSSMKYE
jgi:PPP family 3-phenylpropionic acid transporter